MRIKRFAQGLLAVQAVMVLLLGVSTYLLQRQLERLNQSREVEFRSYLLADELRQSSDDLTRLSRSFVITGNPELERQYWAVLDIRNGKLPRPRAYNRIYWDLVTAKNRQPRPVDVAIPLQQLMINEGFTPAELGKLKEAQRASDALVRAETLAMNTAKGLADDGTGQFTLVRAPDRESAIHLLYDSSYGDAKRAIMQLLDDFYVMFEARTAHAVLDSVARSRAQLRWLSGLLGATLLLLVWSFVALLRQSAEREAAQLALAESEVRYRTIFQTAADGFGIVDKDARICEANDALCRMSGFSAEELRAMRLADLEESVRTSKIVPHLEQARGQENERFSARLKRRDGGLLDVEISAQHRPIDGGRFVVVLRDVTETKRARRELEQLLRIQTLLADLARSFVNVSDEALDQAVHDALRRICDDF